MKEISINQFDTLEEAIIWLENEMTEALLRAHPDQTVKGEVSFINFQYRVGVITEDKQMEFEYDVE